MNVQPEIERSVKNNEGDLIFFPHFGKTFLPKILNPQLDVHANLVRNVY